MKSQGTLLCFSIVIYGTLTKYQETKQNVPRQSFQRQNIPKTKRPKHQNVPVAKYLKFKMSQQQNDLRLKTSQLQNVPNTKSPKPQHIPNLKTCQGSKCHKPHKHPKYKTSNY